MQHLRSGVTLAVLMGWTLSGPAAAQQCTRPIESLLAQAKPSVKKQLRQQQERYKRHIDRLVKRMRLDAESASQVRALWMADADTQWVCTENDKCCENIPLKVVPIAHSSSRCTVGVAFPYSSLFIERNGGNYKPEITWKLAFQGVPADYGFGDNGIKIEIMGGSFPPVHTDPGNADKCKPAGGGTDTYRCKGNGKKAAQAGHLANVYPKSQMNVATYRCDNIDPLIVNSSN